MQYNGLKQLLATATRRTLGSPTLLYHIFRNSFFDNLDCGTLYPGLFDHCVIFVKLQICHQENDYTHFAYRVFPSFYEKNVGQIFSEIHPNQPKIPNFYDNLDE